MFVDTAAIRDLEESIELHRAALDLRSPGHPGQSSTLHKLTLCLPSKYGELEMVGDSKEAITIGREALELCTPGHPGRCESLHNLACSLRKRYDKLWVVDDLEEAIALGRTALELCPLGHPDRGICLQNLACDLKKRPMQKTATGDLEESIELLRLALEPRPAGHPDRSSSIYELALSDDLEEAILCGRVALGLCPSGHPDHGVVLYNLACDFWRKLQFLHQATSVDQFQKQAVVADLDNAICLATYALEFRLPAEDDSVAHGARFQAQHAIIDLKKAITFYRHVLQLCPGGHPNRASSLHDLAHGLADRFREQPSAINLDEAIALQQEALQILGRRDAGYDVSRRSLAACVQMKIRTQVLMMSSDVSCVTHFDVEQVIRDVAFETFKTMPTRLLHTHDSGILYDRDAQPDRGSRRKQYPVEYEVSGISHLNKNLYAFVFTRDSVVWVWATQPVGFPKTQVIELSCEGGLGTEQVSFELTSSSRHRTSFWELWPACEREWWAGAKNGESQMGGTGGPRASGERFEAKEAKLTLFSRED
ncbi:hypothetical protein EDD16DRAFT_1904063 [Pisolithus croceorrhizus]|nr:hypothetical protein EDD16DRAFT_1904063 [Pisolithus croceorrhizus]